MPGVFPVSSRSPRTVGRAGGTRRRFCGIIEDERLGQRLADAIRGRGAFRRFKAEIDRNGLLDRWFDFKRSALREPAIAWCIENDITCRQP